MGERRELPKTQFDQRWETFVRKVCVCVCVIIKKPQWSVTSGLVSLNHKITT